jgi:signal transduction histidine kinase
MTGEFLLDWAIMAVSLFNTIQLLWLGLTILLNAERRTWGTWLAGGGTLMGGAFFVSHSAILGHGLHYVSQGMDFWWRVGWVPAVALPFAWYVVMLWYSGLWHGVDGQSWRVIPRDGRQGPWFLLTTFLAMGLIGLLIFANPLPSYWQVAQLDLSATLSVGGIPVLILVYPIYIVLCIVLSLDALRHPGPSARVMGDLARRRARPWLMAASVVLLLASLLVAWVMVWIVLSARQRAQAGITVGMAATVGWFDLVIAGLIGAAVTMLGQAIVSYEVFTGKTLPRRGFLRHWRNAVILAAGYGVVMGWSMVIQLRSVYSLLLTTILMVVFYALFSWRSYAERERYIDSLRPFVTSERLYEHLLTPQGLTPQGLRSQERSGVDWVGAQQPFRALCQDVLETRRAYLIALGPLAPLVGPPLVYPDSGSVPPFPLADVVAQFESPRTVCVGLDLSDYGGATWAVPLWSERGLIGVLLLGEKRDGGLYTQEEIEIARASGERLIDTQASAELARRLMDLQRQRLAQSQVIDQRARRVLHDDVLPGLHAAMLTLSSGGGRADGDLSGVVTMLADAHRQIADLLREMPAVTAPEVARLGLVGALRQVVEDELEAAFDEVVWQVAPEAEREMRAMPPLTAEVLFYAAREAVRNAARHGRGGDDRPLHLTIKIAYPARPLDSGQGLAGAQELGGLKIVIEDDGVGMGPAPDRSGDSGQGLALHSTMMAVIGGTLAVESMADTYTCVSLTLPSAGS